jgi:hypothetical protein
VHREDRVLLHGRATTGRSHGEGGQQDRGEGSGAPHLDRDYHRMADGGR